MGWVLFATSNRTWADLGLLFFFIREKGRNMWNRSPDLGKSDNVVMGNPNSSTSHLFDISSLCPFPFFNRSINQHGIHECAMKPLEISLMDLLHTKLSQAMNSNSKSPVSSDLTAKKQNGKDVVSSAEPVKRVGQTGVSLSTAVSSDSKSKKPNGKAVVSSSAVPAILVALTPTLSPAILYQRNQTARSLSPSLRRSNIAADLVSPPPKLMKCCSLKMSSSDHKKAS
ncbi:hypothetical protein YC2023_089291 [Brassica napus]